MESLAAGWSPPLQVSPRHDERGPGACLVCGLPARGDREPTYRDAGLVEVKSTVTAEVIFSTVTCPIRHSEAVVLGLMVDGQLVMQGKSVPLSKSQSEALAAVLTAAGPDHPWLDEVSSSRFGSSRAKVGLTKVEPVRVAEILADAAFGAPRVPPPGPVRPAPARPDEARERAISESSALSAYWVSECHPASGWIMSLTAARP